MHLYLHIGTEKTGSSFLQKVCADNRQFLLDRGFFFPSAGSEEKRLVSGSISPGNARGLTNKVNAKSWDQVDQWLSKQISDAEAAGCRKLLLSNENLVVALSKEERIENFTKVATSCGAEKIDALLMIRDPVDQAISLYKHRSKNGLAGSVDQWVHSGYKLPDHVSGFLAQVDESVVSLRIRKYTSESKALVSIFFSDWLSVGTPPTLFDSPVNPSLTLSEIRLLRAVAAIRSGLSPTIYNRLVAIPVEQKARDRELEDAARIIVENHISKFGDLWSDLSSRMAHDGGVELPKLKNGSSDRKAKIVLNDRQVSEFVAGLVAALSDESRVLNRVRRVVRSVIAKSRKIMARSGK